MFVSGRVALLRSEDAARVKARILCGALLRFLGKKTYGLSVICVSGPFNVKEVLVCTPHCVFYLYIGAKSFSEP